MSFRKTFGPPDNPPPGQPGHVHYPACGPAFFDEGGWARRVRHPLAFSIARVDVRRRRVIAEGRGGRTERRAMRGALVAWLFVVSALYVGTMVVPDPFGYMFLLVCVVVYLHRGAHRNIADVRAYRDGWLDGRLALVSTAHDYPGPNEWIKAQMEHDAVVLGGLPVEMFAKVPDDLSTLSEGDGRN